MAPGARPGGFTLVELAMVLAVVAVLSAMVAPSFKHMVARHRLMAAAHTLQADLAYARHEGLRRGQDVHLEFHVGQPWCYALSLGHASNCQLPQQEPHVLKRVVGDSFPQVLLLQANPMVLSSKNGLRQGALAQAVFATATGPKLAVQLGALGRASLCTPLRALAGVGHCAQLGEP